MGLTWTRASSCIPSPGAGRPQLDVGAVGCKGRKAPCSPQGTHLCHPTAPQAGVPDAVPYSPATHGRGTAAPGSTAPWNAAPRPRPGAGHLLLRAGPRQVSPGWGRPRAGGAIRRRVIPAKHSPGDPPAPQQSHGTAPCTPAPKTPQPRARWGRPRGPPVPPSPSRPLQPCHPQAGARRGRGCPLQAQCGGRDGPCSSSSEATGVGCALGREGGGGDGDRGHPAFRWAPPLWLLLQAARGRANAEARGEAPPHSVRHRPFKEGEILHINKRGPRERGGGVPSRGRRRGGARYGRGDPPPLPPPPKFPPSTPRPG